MAKRKSIRTDIGWSNATSITVKGFDLCKDILGKLSLGDMAFLELTDRLPNPQESAVFNAIAVTLVEHGIAPSSLAARMTYSGAPEAMQAAVGAGLAAAGGGSVARLRNSRGVELEVSGKQVGFMASIDLSGLRIRLT